jgi:hypothetical protein
MAASLVGTTLASHGTTWFVKSQTYTESTHTLQITCVPLAEELARRDEILREDVESPNRLDRLLTDLGFSPDDLRPREAE